MAAGMKKKPDVSTPTLAYQEALTHWALPHALMGGTHAMVEAGEEYLPKEPKESRLRYNNRLSRSTLFPAYQKTVRALSGKPFTKPIQLKAPQRLLDMVDNVDLAGRNLTTFALDLFTAGLDDGVAFILVEYPVVDPKAVQTLDDQRRAGVRPYFCLIEGCDLIEAQSARINGVEQLARIRISETTVEPDGDWGEKEVTRIRVIYPDRWELWQQKKDGGEDDKWEKVQEGVRTVGKITLSPFYTNRTGFMTGLPPLEDLAYLNRKHWQSQSDQDNILHFARVPILFGRMLPKDAEIEMSVTSMISSQDPQAEVKWVEHNGNAISAGKESLEQLELKMAMLGYEPLARPPTTRTATETVIDTGDAISDLEAWARNCEAALELAFTYAADWEKIALPAGQPDVTMPVDFELIYRGAQDIDKLIQMRLGGELSRETFLAEVKRRGMLADSLDIIEEIARIGREGPALADITNNPPGGGGPPFNLPRNGGGPKGAGA